VLLGAADGRQARSTEPLFAQAPSPDAGPTRQPSFALLTVTGPQAVAVRIYKVNLTTPGLNEYVATELPSDSLEVVDSQMDQRVWPGVARVLRQEQPGRLAPGERHDDREARLKSVLPLLLVPEPPIPGN
jgi:hypothetical protein